MVDVSQSHRTLRRVEHDPAAAAAPAAAAGPNLDLSVLVDPIALLTENDIRWLNFLCKKKYSDRYDSSTTETWFRNIVLKSPMTFYATRTEHAFQISMLSVMPWLPAEPECIELFVCADDGYGWEALKLLRDSIEWARKRRCTVWRLSSDPSSDVEALARRLGATEISPRYTIRF